MSDYDSRAGELLALAIAEGIDLPMTVDEIIRLEDAGFIVDLLSGEVLSSVTAIPTIIGVGTVVAWEQMERQHGQQ